MGFAGFRALFPQVRCVDTKYVKAQLSAIGPQEVSAWAQS
jgi:hypothetical protein